MIRPSSTAAAFSFSLITTALLGAIRLINTDGDLARHLRLGMTFLERGEILRTDSFSFTRPEAPFLPFAWLSEIVYALSFQGAGFSGVIVLSSFLIATSLALVVHILERARVRGSLIALAFLLALSFSSVHWIARPHLFSITLSALLLSLLMRPSRRLPWLLAPLFALWANLHGGFLFGLILVGLYALGSWIDWGRLGRTRRLHARAQTYTLSFLVSAASILINPFGFEIYGHLLGYLAGGLLPVVTAEYQTLPFHLPESTPLLFGLVLLIAPFLLLPRRLRCAEALVFLINFLFVLRAARHFPLFAVTAIPIAILHVERAFRRFPGPVAVHRPSPRASWALSSASLLALILSAAIPSVRASFYPDSLSKHVFPIDLVEEARRSNLRGRIFHPMPWGGFMLLAWPEQKIFMDGQTDIYGDDLAWDYLQLIELQPGWRDTLSRHRIDLVLMPVSHPMVHELARDPSWKLLKCDPTAAFLMRGEGDPASNLAGVGECYRAPQNPYASQ